MVLLVEDDFAEVGYKDFENLSPSLAVFVMARLEKFAAGPPSAMKNWSSKGGQSRLVCSKENMTHAPRPAQGQPNSLVAPRASQVRSSFGPAGISRRSWILVARVEDSQMIRHGGLGRLRAPRRGQVVSSHALPLRQVCRAGSAGRGTACARSTDATRSLSVPDPRRSLGSAH